MPDSESGHPCIAILVLTLSHLCYIVHTIRRRHCRRQSRLAGSYAGTRSQKTIPSQALLRSLRGRSTCMSNRNRLHIAARSPRAPVRLVDRHRRAATSPFAAAAPLRHAAAPCRNSTHPTPDSPSADDPARNRVWILNSRRRVPPAPATPGSSWKSPLPSWQWVDAPYGCPPDLALGPEWRSRGDQQHRARAVADRSGNAGRHRARARSGCRQGQGRRLFRPRVFRGARRLLRGERSTRFPVADRPVAPAGPEDRTAQAGARGVLRRAATRERVNRVNADTRCMQGNRPSSASPTRSSGDGQRERKVS